MSPSQTILPTLDPDAGLITTINTYTVTPERAEEVLRYLEDAASNVMGDVPGFLSFNYHLSFDRTLIVNYGQWESREAVMAARENTAVVTLMAETEKVAGSSNSKPYVLCRSFVAERREARPDRPSITDHAEGNTMEQQRHQTPAVHAQPGPMPAHSSERVARNLKLFHDADDAFNRRDWAYLERAHHPNLVAHTAGSTTPLRGHGQLSAMLNGMLHAFPDMRVSNDYPLQFGEGDWTTAMARVSGTFSGAMHKPDGTTIPGTGKSFDLWMTTNARWENDQLVEEWVFWDTLLLAQQIGLA